MKTTIIGHTIHIIGLDDIDLTAENDSFIINGDKVQKEKALKKVKEPYSVYAIDNEGSTENVESGLSLDEAKILKEKLTQELRDGAYINTTSSLKVITEFDFDQL